MNPTINEFTVAIVLTAVAVAMVVWFHRDLAFNSLRRMKRMMTRIGLDPNATNTGDPQSRATLKEVKRRCLRCTSEDYCERWLDGEVTGDNDFCPNAQTFRELKRSTPPKSLQPTADSAL